MNKNDVKLKIDWASHESAKYACEHWHYSKCVPAGKIVKIGVWENDYFIGCVLFSRGANNNLPKMFNLKHTECVELVRVALRSHISSVSKIISIALKFLKKLCPEIRLIVSYADTNQGHIGAIYQAGNWVYSGGSDAQSIYINGIKFHARSISSKYGTASIDELLKRGINAERKKDAIKHRYLMPLDKEMRKQIIKLAKPYPKKSCPIGVTGNTSDSQSEDGGSNPTVGLNSKITNG